MIDGTETMLRQSAGKRVFTTGDVARICHVASRTVTKWFDTGKLRGYRIPGSRDRRIPLAQLAAFMKENNLPMGEFDSAVRKVLVIDSDIRNDLTDEFSEMENYTVCTASTCFEAGLAAREILPHVIVISLSGGMTTSQVREIKRSIRTHKLLKNTSLFAAVDGLTTNKENELLSHGFDRCLCWPYTSEDLTNAIEETMDFVI